MAQTYAKNWEDIPNNGKPLSYRVIGTNGYYISYLKNNDLLTIALEKAGQEGKPRQLMAKQVIKKDAGTNKQKDKMIMNVIAQLFSAIR